ncbi:hypothetical protein [Aureispira anguillae]|uniref:Lipoprotein n=1 Tax=Aureispira anguillae TaxID=2864201 RepID=A0A916DWS7_9BACT|nr:hypothetical protein [Aureispira anguillae]BDS15147.1 hypothetical protein AsAng_0059310 [Aureispira anguillae]
MKYAIPALACLFLLVFSCRTTPLEEVESLDPQLDGQSIFKTVFFNLGDAADRIPSFKDNVKLLEEMSEEHPEFMENYIANIDRYIEQIERTNPDYFEQLKKAVYAPDFLEIKKAMELGNLLILPTIVQSNLDKIEDEALKRELQEAFDVASVNFKSQEQLKVLSSNLLDVISKHKPADKDLDTNNGRALDYNLNFNYNYSLDYNYNYTYNFIYVINLARIRILNYNYNYNFNFNFNFNYLYNIAIPADGEGQTYDNYTGEELIREIAAGFNQ